MDDTSRKKSRAAYYRRWRKERPEKHLAIQRRYIEKKLKQLDQDKDNDQK